MMLDSAARFQAFCGGVTFTGRRFDYTPGVYVREVEGILSGGTTEHESIASGAGDGLGEFDTPNVRTGPRIITLTGFVYARTMWELGAVIRRLDGLLHSEKDPVPFVWEEFGEKFHTAVLRGRDAPARRRGATGFADYTIRFRAPKQPYFGERAPENTDGPGTSITLVNRGSFTSFPVLTINDANMPSGYKIVSSGVEYVVTQSLTAGQTHVVDMRDRVLYRNGSAQRNAVSAPRLISIPPYSSRTIALVPASGTGKLSGVAENTFI